MYIKYFIYLKKFGQCRLKYQKLLSIFGILTENSNIMEHKFTFIKFAT